MPFHPVKHYISGRSGAPELYGAPGQGIAVLRACLVEGFNPRVIQSITVEDGVATAHVPLGHGYTEHDILLLGGASDESWNDEITARNVTVTGFQFDAPSPNAPAPAPGQDLSARVAPVGYWEEVYTGTNKAVFRSTHPDATGRCLWIDDSDAQYMRWRGYESMTDVDIGVGPFPTFAQVAPGAYSARKSSQTSAAACPWVLCADSLLFYWLAAWNLSYPELRDFWLFGDPVSYKLGDEWHGMIAATAAASFSWPSNNGLLGNFGSAGIFFSRSFDQLQASVPGRPAGAVQSPGFGGQVNSMPAYPSPVDGGVLLHPTIVLHEGTTLAGPIRGHLPGVLQPLQHMQLSDLAVVDDVAAMPDRKLLFVSVGNGSVLQVFGRAIFDITGPWR